MGNFYLNLISLTTVGVFKPSPPSLCPHDSKAINATLLVHLKAASTYNRKETILRLRGHKQQSQLLVVYGRMGLPTQEPIRPLEVTRMSFGAMILTI